MKINPYLFFNGSCEEAFKFYEKTLNGQIIAMVTQESTPMADEKLPEWENKIMHARLIVGDQLLMGSDSPPEYYKTMQGSSVSLTVDEPAEADRIFAALKEGGNVTMEISETFWAHRFGMLTDKFGIAWMVNCEKPMG